MEGALPATDRRVLWSIPPPPSHDHLKVLLCTGRGFSTVFYHENKIALLASLNSE